MHDRQPNTDDLVRKYEVARPPSVRALVERVLGTGLANGYTTVSQAEEVAHLLELRPSDVVLDLGAGRGWPGIHLAGTLGCRLVSTDLTVEAARLAKACVHEAGLDPRVHVTAVNGVRLPFAAKVFNAVVHADVLC